MKIFEVYSANLYSLMKCSIMNVEIFLSISYQMTTSFFSFLPLYITCYCMSLKVAPKIKEGMTKAGTMLIGYQPDEEHVNFFRMIITNLEILKSDMDFVINEIDRLGKDL